jgi:hypothetical protein
MEEYAEEFALGLLDGAERAAVVAHLEGCRPCGAQVALLAEAGEQLLLLAPEVEPPVGFEQRVLAQVVPDAVPLSQQPRHLADRRLRRRWSGGTGFRLAMAAALVLVVGLAALVVNQRRESSPDEVTAVMISAHGGGNVGKASVVDDRPMVVELYMADWLDGIKQLPVPPKGPWTLAVDRAGGAHEEHTLALARDPTPHITLHPGDQPVRQVAIQDSTGHVWCWATFATTA